MSDHGLYRNRGLFLRNDPRILICTGAVAPLPGHIVRDEHLVQIIRIDGQRIAFPLYPAAVTGVPVRDAEASSFIGDKCKVLKNEM